MFSWIRLDGSWRQAQSYIWLPPYLSPIDSVRFIPISSIPRHRHNKSDVAQRPRFGLSSQGRSVQRVQDDFTSLLIAQAARYGAIPHPLREEEKDRGYQIPRGDYARLVQEIAHADDAWVPTKMATLLQRVI
jgi:hypothetical protein